MKRYDNTHYSNQESSFPIFGRVLWFIADYLDANGVAGNLHMFSFDPFTYPERMAKRAACACFNAARVGGLIQCMYAYSAHTSHARPSSLWEHCMFPAHAFADCAFIGITQLAAIIRSDRQVPACT